MDLKISHQAQQGGEVISLEGKLNALTSAQVKGFFTKLLDQNGSRLVLDLEGVTFMDSSGLSSLISVLKAAREKGGFLRLTRIKPQVKSVLELTMLDRVFEIFPTVEAALS